MLWEVFRPLVTYALVHAFTRAAAGFWGSPQRVGSRYHDDWSKANLPLR